MTTWIRTPEELVRLASELAACRAVGLDTEADSLHHHFAKVCLVQLAWEGGRACVVDPLAVPDLSPLKAVVESPRIEKVLHGADYDVTILKRDFGFEFANLFDTMIAARFLGFAEVGLQAVVRRELGVELTKASQKDDWSRRPLTARQETYAIADVEHLLALKARLDERLRALGRLGWVLEECEAVAAMPPARRDAGPNAYLRIKGASRLPRRGLAVLRELHEWRQDVAKETDRPAFRILANETLVSMAETRPRRREDLLRVRGVLPRLERHAADILAAVERAMAFDEADLPAPPKRVRPVVAEAALRRIAALRAWRSREAERLGVDVSLVLPQRLIDRLAQAAPEDVAALESIEGLRGWRIEAFGDGIIQAAHGSGN